MVANSNYYHPVVSDMHRVKKHLKGAICTLNSIHHILQEESLIRHWCDPEVCIWTGQTLSELALIIQHATCQETERHTKLEMNLCQTLKWTDSAPAFLMPFSSAEQYWGFLASCYSRCTFTGGHPDTHTSAQKPLTLKPSKLDRKKEGRSRRQHHIRQTTRFRCINTHALVYIKPTWR